jgi:hypothetical protein
MNEQEWTACDRSLLMLAFLMGPPTSNDDFDYPRFTYQLDKDDSPEGKCLKRKLRLFACACCRRIWMRFSSAASRKAIEMAEQYADGFTRGVFGWLKREWLMLLLAQTARKEEQFKQKSSQTWATVFVLRNDLDYVPDTALEAGNHSPDSEAASQAHLLRCIIGNPFRAVFVEPSWQTHTVLALAHSASQERELPSGQLDSGRLAVLADALEDAGCTNSTILEHLREPGSHVRGCWPLDLLLDKMGA